MSELIFHVQIPCLALIMCLGAIRDGSMPKGKGFLHHSHPIQPRRTCRFWLITYLFIAAYNYINCLLFGTPELCLLLHVHNNGVDTKYHYTSRTSALTSTMASDTDTKAAHNIRMNVKHSEQYLAFEKKELFDMWHKTAGRDPKVQNATNYQYIWINTATQTKQQSHRLRGYTVRAEDRLAAAFKPW